MPRYIDADRLKPDYFVPSTSTGTVSTQYVSLFQILNAPTADAVERKKGKWIKVLEADETGNATYECPFCHRGEEHCPIVEVKFCWNCGAEMEGEDDE